VDIETYGICAAARMVEVKWIMIKGISDWGDNSSKNDNSKEIALRNSARFIFHTIRDGNLK